MKKLLFILFISLSFIACNNNNKMTSYEHVYENYQFDTSMFHVDKADLYKYECVSLPNMYFDNIYITYENGTLWLTCAGQVVKFDNVLYVETGKKDIIHVSGLVIGDEKMRIWYNDNGPIAVEKYDVHTKNGFDFGDGIITNNIEWSKKYINNNK